MQNVGLANEAYQNMNVVRHDDKVIKLIPHAVEMEQARGDEIREFRPSEQTFPMAAVEMFLEFPGEASVELDPERLGERS